MTDAKGDTLTKIGVTGNHPVWSEDRQDFVRVDSLVIGEQLRDTQGRTLKVGSIEPRAGPEQVYNLEVDVEHVYYVSSAGVLVHNADVNYNNTSPDKIQNNPNTRQLLLFPMEPYNRRKHYGNTPRRSDREQLGAGPDEVVDHDPPLVQRYYFGDPANGELPGFNQTPEQRRESADDRSRMTLQPRDQSNAQGGAMSHLSKKIKELLGL